MKGALPTVGTRNTFVSFGEVDVRGEVAVICERIVEFNKVVDWFATNWP